MPATSKAQQGLMGADLARLRAGKPTVTGMGEGQLEDFAATPTKGLPVHKGKHHKKHVPPHRGAGRQPKPRGGGSY